jgi:maleate isomerase
MFGVVAPSTNTIVQPDFDRMRLPGITNHHSRVIIPDNPVESDDDFLMLMSAVRSATLQAVDAVMTCSPDYLVMGMSAETFWNGIDASEVLHQTLQSRTGVGVTLGSHASLAALQCYAPRRRLGIITPYMPVGDLQVRDFFEQSGYEISAIEGLKCKSPAAIASVSVEQLRNAIKQVNKSSPEIILQVGTNLSMLDLAARAECELDKPVIAINAATYWHALRQNGIQERFPELGSLLKFH